MKYKSRYILTSVILLMIISGLVWRVVGLQVFKQNFLRYEGEKRAIRVVGTPAYRGMIMDRNGEPLAISTPVDSVWLNPKEFNAKHPELVSLAAVLDIMPEQIIDKAERGAGREFVYLRRHVTPMIADQVRALEIPGVHLKSEYRRYYPAGEVTAHVIGSTNIDEQGKEGLELAFDDWLRGISGSKRVLKDRRGREVQILEGLQETQSGQDMTLSLDQRLQYLAYRELKAAVVNHRAVAGSAVVLDVQTGEVLAMVNQPSFNPNIRLKLHVDGRHRNRAMTDEFEPGSAMKTFSILSALQYGQVTPNTMIDTSPGWITVGGHIVKEDKNRNFGLINVAAVLKQSSNVGIGKLIMALPADQLWDTYTRLGFGSNTGSGFPGEREGTLVKPPKRGIFVLTTMAFGYGLTVNMTQLAQAYAILGAGGVKRPVTFLKQGEIPSGEQVIDPIVARQMVDMLTSVVENGSGAKARVVGYYTAGKTGTARKVAASGGYLKDSHIAVFAGLAPASNPRFAIVVMLDDPKGDLYYGSQIAAPLFSKIAGGALRLFNVAPDMLDNHNLRVARMNENASHHE